MSDVTAVYWATFSASEGWAECDGVRYKGTPGGWIVMPLCKLLVAAGHADGILNFCDAVSGQRHFSIKSIHRAAADERRTREEHIAAVKVAASARAEKNLPEPATIVTSRPGRQVTVPIEDRTLFVQIGEDLVRVTPKQREAFAIIHNPSSQAWQSIHAKTRNWLVREKWVTIKNDLPMFTALGREIAQATENAVSAEDRPSLDKIV